MGPSTRRRRRVEVMVLRAAVEGKGVDVVLLVVGETRLTKHPVRSERRTEFEAVPREEKSMYVKDLEEIETWFWGVALSFARVAAAEEARGIGRGVDLGGVTFALALNENFCLGARAFRFEESLSERALSCYMCERGR